MLSKILLTLAVAAAPAIAATKKPNILFVLTDDQDWHMESIVGLVC